MERDKHSPSPLVYILVCLFGMNASLTTSALWVEYPALIAAAPEGRHLVFYIIVLLEVSNVASVAYLLARKCSRNRLSEVPFIYSSFALGITSFVLLGFFWDHNTEIVGRSHSFILLICTFFCSLITSVSSVTYVPFTATLREPYITGGLFGEGLGRLLAHLVGIAQGVGRKPECQPANLLNVSTVYRSNYYPRTTTPRPILEQRLRFDESHYFFIFTGVVGLCAVCFVCLRCIRGCKMEYVDTPIENMEDVELAGNQQAVAETEEDAWQSEGVLVLDDGTIRHRSDVVDTTGTPRKMTPPQQYGRNCSSNSTLNGPTAVPRRPPLQQGPGLSSGGRTVRLSTTTTSSAKSEGDPSKPRSFFLLMGIAFWTSSILSGPLSSLKAHVCFPVGNTAFLIGAILSTLFTIITCPIALRIHDNSRITIVVALTSLGTILLTYFVALITFSHTTDSKDSPLFGNAGELLATIAWIAITGLFSVAQVTVALLCRDASREAVMWFSLMVSLGAAVGTLCIVDNVSVCKVFRSYEKPHLCTLD